MSLKAKIEAVIYASEEPVTLAQLVGLLGEEAQAELDRAAAAQQTLALDGVEAVSEPTPVAESGGAVAEPTSENPEVEQPAVGAAEAASETPDAGQAAVEAEVPIETSAAIQPTDGDETAMNGAPDAAAADAAAAARAEKARVAKLRAYFREVLDRLVAEYAAPESDRGLEIREVAGGFRFATKPEYHDAVRGFVKSLKPPLKLSLQALETLAVVAYKQPVTSPEISEIRGVDSAGVLGSLIARKLITTAGRKQVIGRPILYKTTKEFLLKFGLKDVAELPSIEEFEKMAGQMAEQEEIEMEDVSGPDGTLRDAPENAAEIEEELESDGEAAAPAPVADEVIVDGRLSGLPPVYDDAADDPSAEEAEIQNGEGS
jgi:segregation and condensation protein B